MPSEHVVTGLPFPQGRGEDPLLYFTQAYLLFLQGLFQQFEEGCFKWSEDIEKTEIIITDQSPIPINKLEFRPAIVVMRGPAQFADMTLDLLQTLNRQTGKRRHTDLIPCTMTINCLSRVGLEAQRIGWICARHITMLRRLLYKMGIHHIVPSTIGPETPPGNIVSGDSDIETIMVTTQSPFYFQWSEDITPLDAPIVRSIESRMQVGGKLPSTVADQCLRELRERPPSMRGQLIKGFAAPIDSVPIKQTVKT